MGVGQEDAHFHPQTMPNSQMEPVCGGADPEMVSRRVGRWRVQGQPSVPSQTCASDWGLNMDGWVPRCSSLGLDSRAFPSLPAQRLTKLPFSPDSRFAFSTPWRTVWVFRTTHGDSESYGNEGRHCTQLKLIGFPAIYCVLLKLLLGCLRMGSICLNYGSVE